MVSLVVEESLCKALDSFDPTGTIDGEEVVKEAKVKEL